MFKNHKISRMFMCRCCNWAFPDKTSLHIHMQSMVSGNPGNVSIIAKSSITPPPQTQNGIMENSNGIFPAMSMRNDLLLRLHERAMSNDINNSALELCALFPSFDKMLGGAQSAEELEDKNNNKVGIRLFSSDTNSVAGEDMDSSCLDMDQKPTVALTDPKSADNELKNAHNVENVVADGSEDGESINEGNVTVVQEEMMDTSEKESMNNDEESQPNENQNAGHVAKLNRETPDLPVLRSAISASPLTTLLYQKKLNSALRNKHMDRSMNSFFYPNPFSEQAMHNAQLALALTLANQFSAGDRSGCDHSGEQTAFTGGYSSSYASPSGSGDAETISDKDGSSVDTSINATSSAPCTSVAVAVSTSSYTSTASTSTSNSNSASTSMSIAAPASESSMCFECQVLRGRLAQLENRCRFLERKTAMQESKIARLESRNSTLASNNRRCENENQLLKEHSERLELRVLETQQRALMCLQNKRLMIEGDETTQLLSNILESCVYK